MRLGLNIYCHIWVNIDRQWLKQLEKLFITGVLNVTKDRISDLYSFVLSSLTCKTGLSRIQLTCWIARLNFQPYNYKLITIQTKHGNLIYCLSAVK